MYEKFHFEFQRAVMCQLVPHEQFLLWEMVDEVHKLVQIVVNFLVEVLVEVHQI